MTNILKLMQAAKKMQKDVEATQAKLESTIIVGNGGKNNEVTIETTGHHLCKSVKITESALKMPQQELEQAILAAFNSTHAQIKSISKSEFSQLAEAMANESKED